MTYARAVKIMAEAARTELVRLAFDAKLFEKGLCNTAHAENCYKKRLTIIEAIDYLKGLEKDDFHQEK